MGRYSIGTTQAILLAFVVVAILCPVATAQQVSIGPSAAAGQCLVVDTLWISFDGALQDVEAAYFSLGYDNTHVIPMAVIKAPGFDSSVFLDYTIYPGDSITINMGFLVGNFNGPGNVAGLVYAPGTMITSTNVGFLASVLRDPDNNGIAHSNSGALVTTTCCCRWQGDLDSSGAVDILDVVADIDYIFRNGAVPFQDPGCPVNRGEVNCTFAPDVLDVVTLVNVAFRNYDYATTVCNPCDCDPFPTGCP